MKKIIISLLIILLIVLIGWVLKDITIQNSYAQDDRFIKIYTQSSSENGIFNIYYDKTTRIMYLCSNIYKGGGMTVLVDQDGKPLLYDE